jgi:cell division cycle protein 37
MASRAFNYSKWDNIELSDDESDLHPNIDKESWFRLKHRTRLEREAKEDEEVKKLESQNSDDRNRLLILKSRLGQIMNTQDKDEIEDDIDAVQGEINEIEKAISGRNKYISDVQERRKWNIDNICKVSEEKTIIGNTVTSSLRASDFKPTGATEKLHNLSDSDNREAIVENMPVHAAVMHSVPSTSYPLPSTVDIVREKFAVISYNDFVLAHEDLLETYSEIQNIDETKEFLHKHCDVLLHEHAQSYMLLSSLEDEMNKKHERCKLVCRQSQILAHIQELGNSMHRDPRDVVLPFFKRIEEKSYYESFLGAVEDFRKRIQERAIVKRKEMDEENRREMQLGPGGLDPMEVLESLPTEVKRAFESQDIEGLQSALASLDPEVAKDVMDRCVKSGLWVPKE